ncbi:MAG: ankyrin repeat domain-containing protein [Spirochaetaceae bacterium]|jgi:ankyrin repeat protein|nr:ankyrin repeat domain-containing protein [Spirochaetaceae bacterium]
MWYLKIRFYVVFFGIGIIFLAAGGCAGEPAPAPAEAEEDDVWALLDHGETGKARDLFLGRVNINARDSRGRTPLHAAAELGDSDLAAFFISLGAEVDTADDSGKTPLGIAAENTDSGLAEVLVNGGADIHQVIPGGGAVTSYALGAGGDFLKAILSPASVQSTGKNGRTILHMAADAGDTENVRIILAAGAPVNKRDNSEKTALDLALSHKDASKYAEAGEMIILAGGTSTEPAYSYFAPAVRNYNYDIRSADGFTPLHYASQDGNIAIVTHLLNKNADTNAKNTAGTTALHEAARAGHTDVMKILISRGANANIQDAKGNSVLHIAIPQQVQREAVMLLLASGANPNLRDEHGDSPLHIVITLNSSTDVMKALLEGGADVSIHNIAGKTPLYLAVEKNRGVYFPLLIKYKSDIFAADNYGVTPFEKALKDKMPALEAMLTEESVLQSDSGGNTALHIAVKENADEKIIRHILDRRALINARNKEGDTSLHLAVRLNYRESGELLLSRGADIFAPNGRSESPIYLSFYLPGGIREWMFNAATLETRDSLGNSVLHYVAQWRLDSHIPYLVQKGANPDAANATGETPLFAAVKVDSPSTIRALIQSKASINWRDSLGNSALHASVRWNAVESARALCASGIDINTHALTGKTPLHDAVRLGILDVEAILINAGADLEERDNEGNTPFMDAVLAGPPATVERLANLGADTMVRNSRGDTPLHFAVSMERSDLVTMLLSFGVSIHAKNTMGKTPFTLALDISPRMVSTLLTKDRIYASDDNGYSPLHIAILNRASLDIVKTILDQGARISAVDFEGRIPLRVAIDLGSWETAKLLADNGSNPFSMAGDGKTPAGIALAGGSATLRALFSGRAIDSQDSAGNTILHYAAQTGSGDLVSLLIELGADKNSRNIASESPADIARRWNRADIAALLNS